jgi:NAD(P)-dependent dehydrogenase (short-subunit alcohol dehydrogenase family)
MEHLNGKTIVITGASKGIGAAAARFLAEHGANVVLAARSGDVVKKVATEIGDSALGVACDVGKHGDVVALIEAAKARFGRVDVLVNNAGLIDPIARIGDGDPAAWGHVVDVNLKGVYYGIHTVLADMVAQGGGTIINISSGAASNALEGWSHYCATKAGVLSLTKCTHHEYANSGVRVIGLSPGTVATDMQHQIKAAGYSAVAKMDFADHIPPEWVGKAIGYLCGPGGDAYQGTDFTMKTNEGREALGLPAVS